VKALQYDSDVQKPNANPYLRSDQCVILSETNTALEKWPTTVLNVLLFLVVSCIIKLCLFVFNRGQFKVLSVTVTQCRKTDG
jgi:hypothetical protein